MPNVLINPNAQAPLVGFAGNHLGDSVRVGNIFNQTYIRPASGTVAPPIGPGIQGNIYGNGAPGVLTAPVGWQYMTPIKEPGLADAGVSASLVVQQTPAAGGQLPVRGLPSLAINAAYRIALVGGTPMIQLDYPRSIMMAVLGTGGLPSTAFDLYISGADFWGQKMTATLTAAAASVITVIYDTAKCFKYISSMTTSAGTTVPIWVGAGPTFGMDYFTPASAFLNRVTYNNADIAITGGGNLFRAPPLITAAPSATSNDVRGAIRLDTTGGSSMTNLAPLTISYIIYGSTAQSAYTYDLASNQWAPTAESVRVANEKGSPQYYDALLSP